MKSISNVYTLLLAAIFLYSCGGSSSTENERSKEDLAEEKTIHDIDKLVDDFPLPSLVPFTLKSIGTQFSRDLINDTDKVESYKGNKDKIELNRLWIGYDICRILKLYLGRKDALHNSN